MLIKYEALIGNNKRNILVVSQYFYSMQVHQIVRDRTMT